MANFPIIFLLVNYEHINETPAGIYLKNRRFYPGIFNTIDIICPLLTPHSKMCGIAPACTHIKTCIGSIVTHPTPAKITNTVLLAKLHEQSCIYLAYKICGLLCIRNIPAKLTKNNTKVFAKHTVDAA